MVFNNVDFCILWKLNPKRKEYNSRKQIYQLLMVKAEINIGYFYF